MTILGVVTLVQPDHFLSGQRTVSFKTTIQAGCNGYLQ